MKISKLLIDLVLGLCVVAIIVGGCMSCAHAATLRVAMTAPALDNGGACGVGAILIPASDSVWVFVQATGINDSVRVVPGASVVRTFTVPPGNYSVRAYAARFLKDGTKVSGCDTTATLKAISQPGSVLLQ